MFFTLRELGKKLYIFVIRYALTSFIVFSISEYNSGLAETLKVPLPAKRLF